MAAYTAKLYIHTIRKKGSQVIDSPVSTFQGLRYREIDMVGSFNEYKVESFKS